MKREQLMHECLQMLGVLYRANKFHDLNVLNVDIPTPTYTITNLIILNKDFEQAKGSRINFQFVNSYRQLKSITQVDLSVLNSIWFNLKELTK